MTMLSGTARTRRHVCGVPDGLEDSLIVTLTKPFEVRVVLNSQQCPSAGEV